ncbi:MAG: hypothetical protein AAFQ65_02005 [Myxococcota bacterium]
MTAVRNWLRRKLCESVKAGFGVLAPNETVDPNLGCEIFRFDSSHGQLSLFDHGIRTSRFQLSYREIDAVPLITIERLADLQKERDAQKRINSLVPLRFLAEGATHEVVVPLALYSSLATTLSYLVDNRLYEARVDSP